MVSYKINKSRARQGLKISSLAAHIRKKKKCSNEKGGKLIKR